MAKRAKSATPPDRLSREKYLRLRLQELEVLSAEAAKANSWGPAVSALEESRKVRAELDELVAMNSAEKAPVDGPVGLIDTLRSVRRARAGAEKTSSYTAFERLVKTEAELLRQIREVEAQEGAGMGAMTEDEIEDSLVTAILAMPEVRQAAIRKKLGW